MGRRGSGSGIPRQSAGNTHYGPVNLQTGDHSVQNNYFSTTPRSPLDVAADTLADAVQKQWEDEAGFRRLLEPAPLPVRWRVTERKVAGPPAGATAVGTRARFAPLPGLDPLTGEHLRDGGDLKGLHDVYGGVASGRLLLVGPPAAGKTTAAVLLLLEALRYRARANPTDREHIPVPVLLSLNGWDPARERADEWAAGQLARKYTSFRSRKGHDLARTLLQKGRVALFLDGLDEVTGRLRAAMVSALTSAPCRLVLLSRSLEARLTAKKARLSGALALELQEVCPRDAAAYLLHSRRASSSSAWQKLTRHLQDRPGSAVAEVLSRPLWITLVLDVYGDDSPVDELLDTARFPRPRDIEHHLLDHVVTAAYTPRDGYPDRRPRHSPEIAERTLRHLAARLAEEGTHELCWWHIPTWAAPRPRAILLAALVGPTFGALSGLTFSYAWGPVWGMLLGLLTAIGGGFVAGGLHMRFSERQPLPSAGWRDVFTPFSLTVGAGIWTVSACALWYGYQLRGDPMPFWLCALLTFVWGFAATMVSGSGFGIVKGTLLGFGSGPSFAALRKSDRAAVVDTRSIGPRDVWRHHIGLRLLLGLTAGSTFMLWQIPVTAHALGWRDGILIGLSTGCWTILIPCLVRNLAVATALAAVQLSAKEGTPVRLLSFLEDARRRNLLRAVGPVYQFRHSRLQEHLTRQRAHLPKA
ncbi:hypothetical protein [Streptomyces sp. NPDC059649]|uniref:hypothetical protein n=1 Tax=Streptomyces sp. NPDC059649 TaxID=3346895 RepID=UPI00368C1261